MKFVDAYKRLEEINDIISRQNVVDIDILLELQKESDVLYNFCKQKISESTLPEKNS